MMSRLTARAMNRAIAGVAARPRRGMSAPWSRYGDSFWAGAALDAWCPNSGSNQTFVRWGT
jgi:hypothetical protein